MKSLISEIIAYVIVRLINGTISDDKVKQAGEESGKWITDNCRAKVGNSWEKVETALQEKLGAFVSGFYTGIDYDD